MPNWISKIFSTNKERPGNSKAEESAREKKQGDQYLELGNVEAAAACYQRAIAIDPDNAKAHSNLGFIQQTQGNSVGAENSLNRALALDPDIADAHYILGAILREKNEMEPAISHLQTAIRLAPDLEFAYRDLCHLLFQCGQLQEAKRVITEGIARNANVADFHLFLGNLYFAEQDFNATVACFQKALSIEPGRPEILANLSNALRSIDQPAEAAAACRQALSIAPNLALTHCNLGLAMQDLAQLDEAVASFRRAIAIESDYFNAYDNLLFALNFMSGQSSTQLLEEARQYGRATARHAQPYSQWENAPIPERRLRVGLVSGDLRHHPVGYFLKNVLQSVAEIASDRIDLIGYANHTASDDVTAQIQSCCKDWHPVSHLSDQNLAALIRHDEIDILLDLSGHTGFNRLPMFAWKPAPIQVSWLGYMATTGVAAIDYTLTDPWSVPLEQGIRFTEKIWHLPETSVCFTPPDAAVTVSPLPALTKQHITFGCFNNLNKMNDAVVALWAKVLHAVPNSQLFLKAKQLKDADVRQRIAHRFSIHGIAADRLILHGPDLRSTYFSSYHQVDIALDPFPYSGTTTTVEALWMGIPVLTLAGEAYLARQGVSLMMNAGLPDWIAETEDAYIACAVRHAADLEQLAALRSRLRPQVLASPLFDAPRFARHFAAALRGMWMQWCQSVQG